MLFQMAFKIFYSVFTDGGILVEEVVVDDFREFYSVFFDSEECQECVVD